MNSYEQSYFTAIIARDGTIMTAGLGREQQKIGIDSQREAELLNEIQSLDARLKEYYERLVELGDIVPPKSAEQIAYEQAAEQAKINAALLETLEIMNKKIELLEGGISNAGSSPVVSEKPVRKNSPKTRNAAGGSGKRDKPGGADDTPITGESE